MLSTARLTPATTAHSVPRQPGRAGVAKSSNLFTTLPAWCNDEARALLEQIVAEQPERDRPLTQLATGQTASFGFAGRAANRLRQLFDPFIIDRMDWAQSAGFGTDLYWKRRKAVLDYADRCGPDATIAKVLEAAHG